jgi:quercetin dioxygenase-like cupin family protein
MSHFTCRAPATPDVLIDNDKVKVTRWNFTDGAETGWHTHGWDYVVVPLADGKLIAELPGGQQSESTLTLNVPYFRKEGAEHNIINASGKDFAFIEIEIKP